MSTTPTNGIKRAAILPGDPAGIGYEITVKALHDPATRAHLKDARFVNVVYANPQRFLDACTKFASGLKPVQVSNIADANHLDSLYLVPIQETISNFAPGTQNAWCAKCAHTAITRAIQDAKDHLIHGFCTGPIHKGAMRLAGINDIGHTEIFARGFDIPNPTTLFITRDLRIFFYSRHLSLRQAIDALDTQKLADFCLKARQLMHQLGFQNPRLALAALNPHASDGGQFGSEEALILNPAVQIARSHGCTISDPIGADSVFAQAARGYYDAVISLYHDQGHIAAKTYDFERTISATLGLPVLRTSVDHGTAFDIAWQGRAQHLSMMTALDALAKYA